MKSVSNADIRLKNNHNVYQVIYAAENGVTVREITEELKLSLPTVNTCVAHLIEQGLIEYGSLEQSTGGRKPRTLRIVADAKLAIGLVIAAGSIRFLLANLRGDILAFERLALPFADTAAYYTAVSEHLELFINECKIDESRLLGVCMSIAGMVNASNVLETVPTLRMKNRNADGIAGYFYRPLRFVNDANASGFAEWWNNHKPRNYCTLFVETGVGGAFMHKGQHYLGDNLRSAEFGHMVISDDNRLCSCGKKGCLEAQCSIDRLSKDFGLSLDEFFLQLPKEKAYRTALNLYLKSLAKGVANLRFLFDCKICISGLIVPYLHQHEDKFRAYLMEELPFDENCDFLEFSKLKDRSSALGAGLILIADYIKSIQ